MIPPVANAARIIAELRNRLKAEYGLEDGEEALETTLEGVSELPELLAMMARDAVQAGDYAKANYARIDIITERAKRLEARCEKLRKEIAWALQEAGWKKIPVDVLPEFSVSLSNGKRPLVIENEAEIPTLFLKFETVKSVKRKELREWLEKDGSCAGARLGNAQPVLRIGTK